MSIDQDGFRSRIIATPRSGGTDDPRKRTFEEREGGPPLQNQPTPAGAASPSGRLFVSSTERPKRGNPTQIGRFTVLRPIGQGGMGVVYACYDEQLDRKVAVKVLHVEVLRDLAMARARLLREAQTMARLSHANIVTVYEVGQDDDLVHIAMEFVRGVGLDVWTNPERPWHQILATFVQAGRGLEAAHRAGIIHRDFKPQNVIVGEDGVVKVLDFGLARAADGNLREEWLTTQPDQEESFNSHLLRPLTRTGLLLGTPAYMSPEQHCGEVATAASDQFSFCVSLYQCLYGVLPFSTESLAALRNDVMKGHVAPAPLRSPVPLRIYRSLRRGMMTNPEARFSSMTELLTTLERDPGVRYRRLAGLTATAALTGVLGFTLASGGEPAVETCPDARPELVEIWSDERAAEIRQSISTLHGERGMKLLSLVEPQVERYAQGWVQLRNEACRAHAEGRQSDQLFDLRTACLEQRRASLDALTNTLAEMDASSLANIAQATASLPPLETCADAQALTTEVPLPDDAKMRVRVQGHRETLARVQVFEDIGQYRAGLQLAESVLADDFACKYEPLLAEALLHKGSLQMESGDSTEAEKTLSQALWAAFGSAHERVAAQASSKRIFLRAVFLNQWSQAQEEIPEVRALNKRVQRDVELYAEFLRADPKTPLARDLARLKLGL